MDLVTAAKEVHVAVLAFLLRSHLELLSRFAIPVVFDERLHAGAQLEAVDNLLDRKPW